MDEQTNWAIDLAKIRTPKRGEALLYGVLIYTDAHPYVKKMLADDDFWSALDDSTGDAWWLFAARGRQGTVTVSQPKPGTLSMLEAVYVEPGENADLLQAFEIGSTKHLPAVVIFVPTEDGVLKYVVRFSNESVDDAYKSVRKIVQRVTATVEPVLDQNRRQEGRVFRLVEHQLGEMMKWDTLKAGWKVISWLRSQ